MTEDIGTSANYPELTEEQEKFLLEQIKPGADLIPMSSSEDIANVIQDILTGKFQGHPDKKLTQMLHEIAGNAETTIDATSIYQDMLSEQRLGKAIHMYEDHTSLAPPYEFFNIAYQNDHGNIIVMSCMTHDSDGTPQWEVNKLAGDDDEPTKWEEVNRLIEISVWVGGQSNDGERFGTLGPVHMWRVAVNANGHPEDISWIQIRKDYPMQAWDMAMLTCLGALNFLGCRNVEAVEPSRPRAVRRRMERTGVTVKVLNVFPVGHSAKGDGSNSGLGVPLHSVRGHFATYGKDGKGKLFGKYSGKFWRPAYARGSAEHGVIEKDYRLKP